MARKYNLKEYRIVFVETNGTKRPIFRKKGEIKRGDELPDGDERFSFTETNEPPESWEIQVAN